MEGGDGLTQVERTGLGRILCGQLDTAYKKEPMKRALFGIAVVAIVTGSVACNLFTDHSVILGVSKLDAPATISPGSPLTVVLTVTTGGCKSFDHIAAERGTSGASLTAWGQDAAKGERNVSCPLNIVNELHSYQFDPPIQSPFTVQVDRGRVSPLSATVLVQ